MKPAAALRREAGEYARLLAVKEAAAHDPKALIAEINAFDPVTLEHFRFSMYPADADPYWPYEKPRCDAGWLWQADILEWWEDPELAKFLILKARQLGITWLAMARALWLMLYRPGSRTVAYSYTEDEAKKLVQRAWLMLNSLPKVLRDHVRVITPERTDEPSEWIKVKHLDSGLISSIQALPATKKHGHGETVTWGVMDEVARMDYARDIYTAINPATSRGGKLAMISTANGVSNLESGEGNFFHRLYVTRKEKGLAFKFLPWNLEPTRDDEWYAREAMALDEVERNQQYPLNENDAFMLSGALYFDREALSWYRGEVVDPTFSGQFVAVAKRKAKFMRLRDGVIDVYEQPHPDGRYAISVDTATGKGADYTSADVIDLASGSVAAHLHAKMEAPRAAVQLHFLGKWFNTAKIGVERGGGYGDALIIALRDGTENLPVYTNLYRHTTFTRGDKPMSAEIGFPMNQKTRPQVLEGLKSAIRQRLIPFLPAGHVDELGTFVYADTIPSPRAQEGCHDDRVMSLAIGWEMYRQLGYRPDRPRGRRHKKATYRPSPARSM